MHGDPVQVAHEPIVLDQRIGGRAGQLDAGIDRGPVIAGTADFQPADDSAIAGHGHDAAGAVALKNRAGAPLEYQRDLDGYRALVMARHQDEHVAGASPGDGRHERTRLRRDRPRFGRCLEGQGGRRGSDEEPDAQHGQDARGSTNIRPRISMWSAWQNHWQ